MSTSSEEPVQWEEWTRDAEDDRDEAEDIPTVALFSAQILPSPAAVLAEARTQHGFDLRALRKTHGLDFYQCVRLLNYIRSERKKDAALWTREPFVFVPGAAYLSDDAYLAPVLDDDALLFEFEEEDEEDENEYRVEHVDAKDIPKDEQELLEQMERLADAVRDADAGPSGTGKAKTGGESAAKVDDRGLEQLDNYFDSYSYANIHQEMISDKVRTDSYRASMLDNPDVFKDKVVLDVGCGTGILSMFAAQAGARRVIGIDRSHVADVAVRVVAANGFADRITIIKGSVEDVSLPADVDKVDIIISEWMGYALLYETMLESVLVARDQWLAPDGLVFPDEAILILGGLEKDRAAESEKLDFWKDPYGFDMTPMHDLIKLDRKAALKAGETKIVPPECVVTDEAKVWTMRVLENTMRDLDFQSDFALTMARDGELDALMLHFDIGFVARCAKPVWFRTDPGSTPTHWMQSVFYLEDPLAIQKGDVLRGKFEMKRNRDYHRAQDVLVTWTLERAGSPVAGPKTQKWSVR